MGPAQNEVPAGHEVRQVSHELGYYARVMGIGRDEAAVRVRMVYLGVAAAVVGMLSCVAGFALIPLDAKLEKCDGDATAA